MAIYWATSMKNAKMIHDILSIQQRMSTMQATVQTTHQMENVVGTTKSPPNDEDHDSNNEGTTIEISSTPMFGLDDDNFEDVQQPPLSDEFIMVIDDEESSGSQHSTSKPNANKKKKITVSRKEFLNL